MKPYETDISGALFKLAKAKSVVELWENKELKEIKDVLIKKLQEKPRCPERHTYKKFGQPSYREDWSRHVEKYRKRDEIGYNIWNTVKNPYDGHPYNIYLARGRCGKKPLHPVQQIIDEVRAMYGSKRLKTSLNTWIRRADLQ